MLKKTESIFWKSGNYREIATVALTDQEVVKVTGLKIISGVEEGLGEWLAVGGELPTGDTVEIIRYKDSPNPADYIIRIDFEADINSVSTLIFNVLGIKSSLITWQYVE